MWLASVFKPDMSKPNFAVLLSFVTEEAARCIKDV